MKDFFTKNFNVETYSSTEEKFRLNGGFVSGFNFIEPETQKARGIVLLHQKKDFVQNHLGWETPQHLPFRSGTQFSEESFNYPVFARPCPTVPRHGFVDSIVCENAESLNALSLETYNVENGAEILVTKPVDCAFNAICTGDVITIGSGNDGATSGKSCSYFYLVDDPIGYAIDINNHSDVLLEGEVPFYEIVISKEGEVNLVQVRSAPGMPSSKNFIPKKMVVKNIIRAEGDLLEWEKKVKTINSDDTVIDHTGGSLASHFSIHAIINGVAIFTKDCPQIGDEIEPNADSSEITKEEREAFSKSFKIGFSSTPEMINRHSYFGRDKSRLSDADKSFLFMRDILTVSLATLHNYSAVHKHRDFEMLGSILGMFVRTCFAVSSGETRFKRESANLYEISQPDLYKWLHGCSSNRHSVYTKMIMESTESALENIIPIYKIFKDLKWAGGYGGNAWKNCTESAINLYNDCLDGNIEGAVEKFNVVIHTCHNGGLYLNKIQKSSSTFDSAASDASRFSLKNLHYIANIVSNCTAIRSEPHVWENNMGFFKKINVNALNLNIPILPDMIDGKTALKYSSEIMVKICGSSFCYDTHEILVNIGNDKYVAKENVKLTPEQKNSMPIGWVNLNKIPHWIGTESATNIISVKTFNKFTFVKK